MQAFDYLTGSQPAVSMDLIEALSGRKLKTLNTNSRGEFDFEISTPGLYFLRLADGLIAVSVDPRASVDHLDPDIAATCRDRADRE